MLETARLRRLKFGVKHNNLLVLKNKCLDFVTGIIIGFTQKSRFTKKYIGKS